MHVCAQMYICLFSFQTTRNKMKICQTNSENCAVIVSKCLMTWEIAVVDYGYKCVEISVGDIGQHDFHFYFSGFGNCIKPKVYPINAYATVPLHSKDSIYKDWIMLVEAAIIKCYKETNNQTKTIKEYQRLTGLKSWLDALKDTTSILTKAGLM